MPIVAQGRIPDAQGEQIGADDASVPYRGDLETVEVVVWESLRA